MKIGDRVIVSYADGDQFFGGIFGETAKCWKIEFDNGDSKTVRKTTKIELVPSVDETPEAEEMVSVTAEEFVEAAEAVAELEEPCCAEPTKYTPSKKLKGKNVLLFILLLVAVVGIGFLVVSAIF
jgi:hypothetical protein